MVELSSTLAREWQFGTFTYLPRLIWGTRKPFHFNFQQRPRQAVDRKGDIEDATKIYNTI